MILHHAAGWHRICGANSMAFKVNCLADGTQRDLQDSQRIRAGWGQHFQHSRYTHETGK